MSRKRTYKRLSEETDPQRIERRRFLRKLKNLRYKKNHPEKFKANRLKQKRKMYGRVVDFVKNSKKSCVYCGYDKHHSALDYHHLDRKSKKFLLSRPRKMTFTQVRKEMAKCIVLCSNCHRIEEHTRNSSSNYGG